MMLFPHFFAWQRLRAALSVAAAGLCALGCDHVETPAVSPDQFVALRIYDFDPRREGVPGKADLIRLAHVDVGQSRTRRIFNSVRYDRGGEPFISKRLRHYAVARTEDGREHALTIDVHTSALTIEGQSGCYYFEGASLKELMNTYWPAWERVFLPRRAHPLIPGPDVPVPARIGDKYGYADASGEVIIPGPFDDVTPFSEGLAAVRVGGPEDGKWGFIDKTGRFVIEPTFAGASFFSEDLAAVTVDDFFDGMQGYVDRQGVWVIEPRLEGAWPFDGGTARVLFRKKPGGELEEAYIDTEGKFVDPRGRR